MKSYLLRTLGLGKLNTSNTPSTPSKSSNSAGGSDSPTGSDYHFPVVDRKDEEEYKRYEELWNHPFSYLIDNILETEDLLKLWKLFAANLSKETSFISLEDVSITDSEHIIFTLNSLYISR